MPELPEVEHTSTYLRERVLGCRVLGAELLWPRTLARCDFGSLEDALVGATIVEVSRRGKFVSLSLQTLAGTIWCFIHLRMSGSLDVLHSASPPDKYDRLSISLDNGKDIRFSDMRKFGRMYVVRSPEIVVGKLGPEPLSPEFGWQQLAEILSARKGAIKPLLLNQCMIAGIGNIYADECLWQAGIHPLHPGARLSTEKIKLLHKAIRKVLQAAIRASGTDFGDGVATYGMFKPQIYGRHGEPCRRCKKTVQRMVVGQRGTHFCGHCQKRR